MTQRQYFESHDTADSGHWARFCMTKRSNGRGWFLATVPDAAIVVAGRAARAAEHRRRKAHKVAVAEARRAEAAAYRAKILAFQDAVKDAFASFRPGASYRMWTGSRAVDKS